MVNILNEEATITKFNAIALYCEANGYSDFKIVTDKDIRKGNILNNIRFLFSYSNITIPEDIKNSIINILGSSYQDQTINQLLLALCEKKNDQFFYTYILNMLYFQEISANLEEPITKNSLIYLNNQ